MNPIKKVTPVDGDGVPTGDGVSIPAPSHYRWALGDISKKGAGRVESMRMNKLRIGQAVHLELKWNGLTSEDASKVLQAFNSEYFELEYKDTLMGMYLKRVFYAGDRSAPLYNAEIDRWLEVAFEVIQRMPDKR